MNMQILIVPEMANQSVAATETFKHSTWHVILKKQKTIPNWIIEKPQDEL